MLDEIQKFDYDRYLSIIFAPKEKRDDIMAVVLFNLEIARIKSKVTEAMMGHIRLQWWRDAIEAIFDGTKKVENHRVVQQLKALTQKYKLDKNDFLTIINAREKDLEERPFPTEQDFNEYLLATSYPVNKIMLDILGVNEPNITATTQNISNAWAICALLRSAYRNFGYKRQVFPADLMEKHKLNYYDFGKDSVVESSKPLVKELYERAEQQLQAAKLELKNVSKKDKKIALPVLLNIRTTEHHLKQIRKNKFDVFTKTLNPHLGLVSLLKVYVGS